MIKMPKKGEYVKCKIMEDKIEDKIKDNGKQNPDESYRNKYQQYIACSYGHKSVYVENKFSNPFKSHLGEVAVYS